MPLLTDEKRCRKCKRWLPVGQFRARTLRGKPYVEARCLLCVSLAVAAYAGRSKRKIRKRRRKWYAKNRARLLKYEKNRYLFMHRDRIAFMEWLKSAPCADCGKCFPSVCMDLDHCSGEKLIDVSKMTRGKFTNEEVMAELLKCELVCANCHRIRTASRREKQGA